MILKAHDKCFNTYNNNTHYAYWDNTDTIKTDSNKTNKISNIAKTDSSRTNHI
jgi:hypothetical protein